MRIDPDALPQSAKELAELIGLPALLKLVEWRGGVYLSVPLNIHDQHPITHRIGIEAATKLTNIHGGTELEIPRCTAAIKVVLHAQIVQRRDSGETELAVARDVGVTGRWVREIRARHRQQQESGQGDMFEE